jgi:ATP synthase protein I
LHSCKYSYSNHQAQIGKSIVMVSMRYASKMSCRENEEAAENESVPVPLSREEAQGLVESLGSLSIRAFMLKVLVWQVVAGCGVAMIFWLLSGALASGQAALYGSFCVVLPSVVLVRMLSRQVQPVGEGFAGYSVARLIVLEAVKIVLTLCLLVAAPLVFSSVEWVALVTGFAVTLKVYWVVAVAGLRGRGKAVGAVKITGING